MVRMSRGRLPKEGGWYWFKVTGHEDAAELQARLADMLTEEGVELIEAEDETVEVNWPVLSEASLWSRLETMLDKLAVSHAPD